MVLVGNKAKHLLSVNNTTKQAIQFNSNAKLIALLTLSMFRSDFKTLKQLLRAFIRVSGSLIDFDAYFKGLH